MRIAHSQRRGRGRLRARALRGEVVVRRRPRVHREVHRRSAPHRDPGARRQARQRHLSRRARMLDPAPQPEGRSRRRRRRCSTRRRARRWASRRSRWPRPSATTSAGTVEFVAGQDRSFYLPRDEHAPAGRASGDRAGHRHRSRRADDPRRRRREAGAQAERREAQRLGGREPRLCRGPVPQLPALDRPADALPAAGRERATTASPCATTPACTRAARSRSTTIR